MADTTSTSTCSSSAPASPASARPGTCRSAAPGKSYAILEARDAIGGTWDLFRYPGIRSDSDMHTLGYRFEPWTRGQGDRRRRRRSSNYIRETAAEYGIDAHIRYGHQVTRAAWSSADAALDGRCRDTPTRRAPSGHLQLPLHVHRLLQLRRGLHAGVRPASSDFTGRIVHPQHWPDDLDYAGKKRGGDRQRRDGGDPGAGDGRARPRT